MRCFKLWLREKQTFHLSKKSRDPFALIAHESKIYESTHKARIAALVDTLTRSQGVHINLGQECSRARDFKMIIKQRHFDAAALIAVVTVSNSIENRLSPSKLGIFRRFLEARSTQP